MNIYQQPQQQGRSQTFTVGGATWGKKVLWKNLKAIIIWREGFLINICEYYKIKFFQPLKTKVNMAGLTPEPSEARRGEIILR